MADLLKPHGPKKNHRKGIAAAHKLTKREAAEQRQAAYSKLTTVEKLAKLDASGFVAKRQRARLGATK